MQPNLLTADELIRVTGAKRYTKQWRWFREQFGVDVPRRDDGSIVMTWDTLNALIAKRVGVALDGKPPERDFELCYD
jgi:Domain of unknown function (DUF4224)